MNTALIRDLVQRQEVEIKTGPFGTQLKASEYVNEGTPVLNVRNLGFSTVNTEKLEMVGNETLERLSAHKLHTGDIVFGRKGAVERHAYISENEDGWLQGSDCIRLRVKSNNINARYLSYYFLTPQHRAFMISMCSHGTTMASLNQKIIEMISVPLPDRRTQDQIVSILSSFDEKIKNNRKINDNLYEMVNAYYTSLFKESDCEMTTVGNYAERIYSGGTPMTSNAAYWNGTFGWFSSGETRNRFVISTEKTITQAGIDNSSTKLATKYDIVMASAGQGFTRGQTSMLLIDTYVNQSVIVIKSEKNILPYLFWNLANRYDELRAISDSSSIRGSLTTKMIAAFEIPLANEQSLQAFADFAWSVIPQIENNLLENERLTALRDSLLPKLMSGEIDVSDIQL